MSSLTLYTYFRSSAAYRVRIALNMKGVDYQSEAIHLLRKGGEQHLPDYQKLNPQELVPTLVDRQQNQEIVISQSMAIMEYLDENYPQAPLLPGSVQQRAQVRAFAQTICCDVHPLNNLRVLDYLKNALSVDEPERQRWYQHWIALGFAALEKKLTKTHGTPYSFGNTPTMADICLVPQIYNAKRFNCDLDPYPVLMKVYDNCMELAPFQCAAPENQPDFNE